MIIYSDEKAFNTTETIWFKSGLGDITLESIRTTGNVQVERGTNLIVRGNIFCGNLVSFGKVKAHAITCEEISCAKEYDAERVTAFRINHQFIERVAAPSTSPLFVSVEEIAEKSNQRNF